MASSARGFGLNGKSYYTNVVTPQDVSLNFIVDSTNGNGLGVRSIKSNGYVQAVFMKTSATPGALNGLTNPNPQAGFAVVRFRNNFNVYLGGFSGQVVPVTAPTTTALTLGNVYVITVLGTTTQAQWVAAGLEPGFTAAVGVTFVAAATASLSGTGKVGLPGVGNTLAVNAVGNSNLSLASSNLSSGGAQVVVQFSGATAAGNTALLATAPADGTTVGMTFKFDASSVTIDGL
jgi:hypothetical protein